MQSHNKFLRLLARAGSFPLPSHAKTGMRTLVLTISSVVLSGFHEHDDAMEPMVVRLHVVSDVMDACSPRFVAICAKVFGQ